MYHPSSLFILCLCISFNVCTARPLVAVDDASITQHNVSAKETVKKHTVVSERVVTKREGIKVKGIGGVTAERSKPTTIAVHLKDVESTGNQEEISGLVPIKSVVSISWRLPHKKQDQHPGFYSDYSRPRTRPPSHN